MMFKPLSVIVFVPCANVSGPETGTIAMKLLEMDNKTLVEPMKKMESWPLTGMALDVNEKKSADWVSIVCAGAMNDATTDWHLLPTLHVGNVKDVRL